jgi:uncharacterized delta-60 repeat protein
MAFNRGPVIVKEGLVLYIDAANPRSYTGTGSIWSDLSGNNNNGTLTNGPTFSSDKNGAISFDGINDHVVIDDIKFIDNTFTLNMYVKWDDIAKTDMYLFGKKNIIKNYFGGYSGDFISNVNVVLEDPNTSRLYIYGYFTQYNGNTVNHIVATDTNLDIDPEFVTGTGFNNFPFTPTRIALQDDGKTIYIGQFTTYQGTTRNRIARLNTDGSLDTTFNVGTGFNSYTTGAFLDNNGKIYVIGNFTSYNGNTGRVRIIRLNSDGSIDSGFNAGGGFTGAGAVPIDLVVDSDNNIYVTGYFTTYKGESGNNRIIKILENGEKDTSFNTGSGLNSGNQPSRIYITSDNKVFVIGFFTEYNGQPANKMVKLNTNGTIDTSFQSQGTGFNGTFLGEFYEYQGNYILSGDFTEYDGTPSNGTIILDTSGDIVQTFSDKISVKSILSDGSIIVSTLRDNLYTIDKLKPDFTNGFSKHSLIVNDGDPYESGTGNTITYLAKKDIGRDLSNDITLSHTFTEEGIYNICLSIGTMSQSLFINGNLVDSKTEDNIQELNISRSLILGSSLNELGTELLNGWDNLIYLFQIYNRSLSTDEVLQNYKSIKYRFDNLL